MKFITKIHQNSHKFLLANEGESINASHQVTKHKYLSREDSGWPHINMFSIKVIQKKKQTKVVQQKDTELQPIHPKELTFFHFLCLRYGIPIGTKNDVQRYGRMDELRHTCTNKYIPYMTMLKNWYRCCWNRGAPLLFVEHFQPVTSSPFPSQDSGEIWWPFWLNHVRYVQPRGVCNTVEGKSQLRSTSSKNDYIMENHSLLRNSTLR